MNKVDYFLRKHYATNFVTMIDSSFSRNEYKKKRSDQGDKLIKY